MTFSTLNESNLHNTLKKLYAVTENGQMEVEMNGYIYDIFAENNYLIEIQTQNLSKLLPKILDALDKGYKVKLVHPIIITRYIELYDCGNNLISRRKSPAKGSIYGLFRELTGIYPVLLKENFILETPVVNITEFRIRTDENVQAKNNRRHYKKNWNKTGKKLDEILETKKFNSKEDFINLLPENLPEEFSAKLLGNYIKEREPGNRKALSQAYLMIWVLERMNIIELQRIEKRTRIFKVLQNNH